MTVLVRPELPAGAAPLSALERRALAVLRQVRRQRWPTPVMHGLVAADERRFADLCHVVTLVRPGADQ